MLTSIDTAPAHVPVIIVGGGQGGLSLSFLLQQQGIEHLILEKHRIAHAWRSERWDSFCLVTPNRQCRLPGFSYVGEYGGKDPHGFMLKHEIVDFLEAYARLVNPPIREGVAVTRVKPRAQGGFVVETSDGAYTADKVIVAISGYHTPIVPRVGAAMPATLPQIHSLDYRNPQDLPEGGVLVVGSGQSGCQIAEDLMLAGRQVHLAVGDAPRAPRVYRGRDATDWLEEMGHYDMPITEHPSSEKVRQNENHYLTGRDGGREIDLRKFALRGMKLYGMLDGVEGHTVRFRQDLTAHLDAADATYLRIRKTIDDYIEREGIDAPQEADYAPCWAPERDPESLDLAAQGIGSVIWSTGFRMDFGFIDAPVFDGRGYPGHDRGIAAHDGLYFIGLPWLHTWGSGRFAGVARDAAHIVEHIAGAMAPALRQTATA
ncbi:putative flavoprotein involved in K+ transport [Novosphingobium sp. SG751A]|uniref:MSMEG_0569 family flavin-dependent oxidoreductase n=1 Tax=Novosphingobium sp. SG751A TaxID=2587000 RepID=UPI0015531492|nr:MSMEG_0569 family flavin-dependent oxidoreductase [Novosphingobium sp. SG751A]NOW47745.1 putative flavoprotein involved in K+ transport [Novosphingobium sp. SG751A]